jgi:hypothetical protein
MRPSVSFDHRIVWQGSSPSEHGGNAELCFKARTGPHTVICRVSLESILNALHARALNDDVFDLDAYAEEDEERQLCELLFNRYRQAFRDVAQDKILSGQFARPFGETRSVLLGEDELSRKLRERDRAH